MAPATVAAALALLTLATLARAHFKMVYPPDYSDGATCQACSTACPVMGDNRYRLRPSAVWQRGESVNIRYSRNNHHSGFVRLSLVPIQHMYEFDWHKKLAFEYGCWEANRVRCHGDDCGSDKEGYGFQRPIKVPRVYPDGLYALSVVWFGGTDYRRRHGFFPDFTGCSIVKIKGGPLSGYYRPTYIPGDTYPHDDAPPGTCTSASDDVRACERGLACRAKAVGRVPRRFQNGRESPLILRKYIPAPSSDTSVMHVLPHTREGICRDEVCCASSCIRCGGRDCKDSPGGSDNCCTGVIERSGRKCGRDSAPCVRVI